MKAIPIINENDALAVDELDRYADNDTIAALMANLLRADLLIILTVVDGLLDTQGAGDRPGDAAWTARCGRSSRPRNRRWAAAACRSKSGALRLFTEAGEPAIIACGSTPNVLLRIMDGQRIGTVFAPGERKLSARHRWLGSAARPAGQSPSMQEP